MSTKAPHMSQAPEIQWYIARDGKQFGPLSESEMRMFVAMRHLRRTDLVWCQDFTDWRPAPAVFPLKNTTEITTDPIAGIAAVRAALKQAAAPKPQPVPVSPTPIPSRETTAGKRAQRSQTPRQQPTIAIKRFAKRRPNYWPAVFASAGVGLATVCGWLAYSTGLFPAAPWTQRTATASSQSDAKVLADAKVLGETGNALERRIHGPDLWRLIRKEFPDWYKTQLAETERLVAKRESEEAITKHLVTALVGLRKKHANAALSAGRTKLRAIAETFLASLKALGVENPGGCQAFITYGELSPDGLAMFTDPKRSGVLEKQFIAILDAALEGRRAPIPRKKSEKSDTEALARGLLQIGWSQADLQLFGDAKALARTSPEHLCEMVQGWFKAHIAIEDADVQQRLLTEALRPVVAGN